jgi:tripartite-type tricarboxylate transporter receptor subunit TctC
MDNRKARENRPSRLIAVFALCVTALAHGQSWTPAKPVRFIVPQVAGGGADAIGRVIGAGLSERIGQPLVVDNRPGANGGVGAEALIRSPADGHTLLLVFTSLMALNPAVYDKVPYDSIRDFRPLGAVCEVPLVMLASLSTEASNGAELVALAKAKPNAVFAASSGNGAFSHLLVEMLNTRAGIKLTHVPFKGEAPAVQHLLSNQNQAIYIGTPALAISNVNAGRIKALGVTTARRMEQLPNVPSLAEQGVGDFNESFWYGIVAVAGTPANIADTYDRHIGDLARASTVAQSLGKLGCGPMPLAAAEFAERIKADLSKYSVIAKSVGMKVD